jgi:hypothetical protein
MDLMEREEKLEKREMNLSLLRKIEKHHLAIVGKAEIPHRPGSQREERNGQKEVAIRKEDGEPRKLKIQKRVYLCRFRW